MLTAFLVTSLADSMVNDGVVTLREALTAANTNMVSYDAPAGSPTATDTISFAPSLLPGAITLSGQELQITDAAGTHIQGPGATQLAVDANGTSRVFYIGAGAPVTIDSLTVTGGDDAGLDGAGIYSAGTLTVGHAIIRDNIAASRGGGIFSYTSTSLTVTNSDFLNNSAANGAGIYGYSGLLSISDSTFQDNVAQQSGGAVSSSLCTTTITACDFLYNTAGDLGGAIHSNSALIVSYSTLQGNKTANSGGAIYNSGTCNIVNSLLVGNTATIDDGGAIYKTESSTLTVVNSSLAGNVAGDAGGGIYGYNTEIQNSIITLNEAEGFDEAFTSFDSGLSSNNLIGIDAAFVRNPTHGGDGWGDNPETTEIDESANDDYGDLHLLDISPAIDTGSDALAVDSNGISLTTDLGGNPRIVGTAVDLGAYEYQSSLAAGRETPSLTVNTKQDVFDVYDGLVSLREAIWYADTSDLGTAIAFDASAFVSGAAPHTITLNGSPLFVGSPVTIDATAFNGLTIDADGHSNIFHVSTGSVQFTKLILTGGNDYYGGAIFTTVNITLSDLSIKNSQSLYYGGAIYGHGTVSMIDSMISGNESIDGNGGGIYSERGTFSIVNSTVTYNKARWQGGGIYNDHGALTITGTSISNNEANRGAGIRNYISTAFSVTDSSISDNTGRLSAGAIYVNTSDFSLINTIIARNSGGGFAGAIDAVTSTVLIRDSIISGNTTNGNGAGICGNASVLTIENTTIVDNQINSEVGHGGGIHSKSTTLTISDSDISRNSASTTYGNGGGIWADGTTTITNSQVEQNFAETLGGGIYNNGSMSVADSSVSCNETNVIGGGVFNTGELTLTNATVAGNIAANGGGVFHSSGKVTLYNSIIAVNTAFSDPDFYGSHDPASVNFIKGGNPSFVRDPNPGADGMWDGVDDDYGDLHLRPDSSAINAGDNTHVIGTYDLDGKQRIIYTTVDIGAYEYCLIADANYDGLVDANDMTILSDNWGKSGMSWGDGDFNGDGQVNAFDASILAANWGATLPSSTGNEKVSDSLDSAEPVTSILIGPVQANLTKLSRQLVISLARNNGTQILSAKNELFPVDQIVSEVNTEEEVIDDSITELSQPLETDSIVTNGATNDAVLVEDCNLPAKASSLDYERLVWSHTIARRQSQDRTNTAHDKAILAIDLLLTDQS